MKAVILIATTYEYIQMAVNLCLSIKRNDTSVKVGLVYCPTQAGSAKPLLDRFFDAKLEVTNTLPTGHEFAFFLKTDLYNLATQLFPDADAYLYLDSDVIMLEKAKVSDWFAEHEDKVFTAYCNDMYDYTTKTRKRKDYTFWCDPEELRQEVLGDVPAGCKIPQINSSYVFFRNTLEIKIYFSYVRFMWDSNEYTFTKYRGVKPDEFCFNVASFYKQVMPHRNTYRPIFFQCFSEYQSKEYIHHNFSAFGFAGDLKHADYIVKMYNDLAKYYREISGVSQMWEFKPETRLPQDTNPLSIQPLRRRTIFRAGEIPDSEGGIFNPDAVHVHGEVMTILRKEINLDVYKGKYSGTTSIPYVFYEGQEGYDLKREGFDTNLRLEDFRVFNHKGEIWCNHTVVFKDTPDDRQISSALSKIKDNVLTFHSIPKLPFKKKAMEKNWVYFSNNGTCYLVYSLNPYILLYSDDMITWNEMKVNQPELRWFHKDFICNSTNPILIDDSFLIFFHTKSKQVFFHGCALINKDTKELTHATTNGLEINRDSKDGLHKGLMYVSGSIFLPEQNIVRVLYGHADFHAAYNDYDCAQLISEIKKYPV